MYIIKINTDVEKFTFQNSAIMFQIIGTMYQKAKHFLSIKLEIKKEDEKISGMKQENKPELDEKSFMDKLYQRELMSDPIYIMNALFRDWKGDLRPISIILTEKCLFLVEKVDAGDKNIDATDRIRKSCFL